MSTLEHITTIAEFKVDDVAEQAFREGLQARPSCDDLRIEQIAAHYGFSSQANMLCEEAAEYMVALSKLRRGKAELRYLLGYDDIDRIISEKLDRQMRRISDEEP